MLKNDMKLKSKLIYSLNKIYHFGTHLPQYFKKIVVVTLPKPVRQKIKQKKIVKYLFDRILAPRRVARVYVKKGIGRMEFFEILNKRNIEYVLLRWWEDLPEIPPGEDMDILIKDEHRDLIDDLITFRDNGTGMKADIYTVSGAKHGSHKGIPYFQSNLAHTLINSRVLYRGAYVPSTLPYFASLAYHALFHKGGNSGLQGFDAKSSAIEHDYSTILTELALTSGINVDITLTGLYDWLKIRDFAPANDTLTKLIEILPELSILEVPLTSDVRGGELMAFIIRQQLLKDGLLDDFKHFIENEYNLDIIDVRILSAEERHNCTLQIRGGKWDKGPFKYSGGSPAALVVAYDYHPEPLSNSEQIKQSRMTNKNNLNAKYVFRDSLKSLFLIRGDYNGVHSADNETDAWSYISLMGDDYQTKISAEVESRRTRYARKWGIKKLLSFGPESKTELISYNGDVAIKKTFRVDKERFFERELFAVKQLSKELNFIPPLLEEGDGYLVIPYMENILDSLNANGKKKLLASRKNEIIRVINDMHSRGLAYINFTPKNVIITSKNEFYCINFEFLHKYENRPGKVEDSYEIAGLPKDFKGDYPAFYLERSSFNKVWKPYVGRWK